MNSLSLRPGSFPLPPPKLAAAALIPELWFWGFLHCNSALPSLQFVWFRKALNKDIYNFFSPKVGLGFWPAAGSEGSFPARTRGGEDETAAGSGRGNPPGLLITGDFFLIRKETILCDNWGKGEKKLNYEAAPLQEGMV